LDRVECDFEDAGELGSAAFTAARGFLVVLPEHEKSEKDVRPQDLARGTSGGMWRWAAAVVVLALVGGGALWIYGPNVCAAVAELPFIRDLGLIETYPTLALPDQPSIAILPFRNLTGDLARDYLSEGLTKHVIADFAGFGELLVIAGDSTLPFKDRAVKASEIRARLGVHYLLAGYLQMENDRLKVTAELLDTGSQSSLWRGQFDGEVQDLFSVQDELFEQVIDALSIKGTSAARERALRKQTSNYTAYDFYLRASKIGLPRTRQASAEAERLYRKAAELDPDFAQAYSALAWLGVNAWRRGWSDTALDLALDLVNRAISLDPSDPLAQRVLGFIKLENGLAEPAAIAYEKALAAAPNDPELMAELAATLVYLCRAEQEVEHINRAMRTNPLHAERYLAALGWTAYQAGRYEESLAALEQLDSPSSGVRRNLAATYAQLGLLKEARQETAKVLAIDPDYRFSQERRRPYQSAAALEHWLEGLRKAGLPE
jgi:TolB-like protein/Tfp pilus assembly protein PilF